MGLLAVKHLDPVVGIDVHSVLVAPSPTPVLLPHPHVGFMLDLREYVEAAKGVVGSIAMMIAQEKVTEYIEAHPDDVKKLEHLTDSAMQQLNDLAGVMGGKLPDIKDNPIVAEGLKLNRKRKALQSRISNDLGSNVGMGGSSGRPIFVNGLMRATAGTHSYHVPGLHFPLGESFAPPPKEDPEPSNDGESFMGSKTVLANNDPMSFMALQALSCWSIGMEPPSHNSAHTDRTYPSMPSSVMLPIPAGRPVMVGGQPVMNMVAAAKGLFKSFQGSDWAHALADKLHLKPGFLRCNVLKAEPVDVTTGEVIVRQSDFTVSGRLPLVWERHYASHNAYGGAVGVGWQTPADIRLELMRHDREIGAVACFPDHTTAFDLLPGDDGWSARVYDWQYGYALHRQCDRLMLRTRDAIEYTFMLPRRWSETIDTLDGHFRLTLPIERMADLNGNAWVFERNICGYIDRITEWMKDGPAARVIECNIRDRTYCGSNDIHDVAAWMTALSLIDRDGCAHPLVTYEQDDAGNLRAAVDAMAQPHRFDYTDDHRMVGHTSARGVSFHYSYCVSDDNVWRVDRAWGDEGLFDYRFMYDPRRKETRITDSRGFTTILQLNGRDMPVAEIDPLGGVTAYRYDAQGRANARTDPAGRTITWDYDPYGNVVAHTLPDGSVIRAQYDAEHRPFCVASIGGRQWRYEWDAPGNLLAHIAPSGATSRYTYDRYGQLVEHTGPRGAFTRLDYDNDGHPAALTNALGHRTLYRHDARGNLAETIDALGQRTRYEYDRNGNLTRAIEPGGREVHCVYDADGNLVRYRDAAGHVTQMEYSALGQVRRRLAPDGRTVEYRYDTEEQLVGIVNERGELYALERDALGQIVTETDYWGQARRYRYGAAGELVESTNPLGHTIEYRYDRLGRIVQKSVPDPSYDDGVRIDSFTYDRNGDLVLAQNPCSRVEFRHDEVGRVIEERQGKDFTITSDYDAAGNRTERRTRLVAGSEEVEHTVRYAYDALDAATSIQIDDSAPVVLERDAMGRIRSEQLGPDLRRELSYQASGQLASQQTLLAGTGVLFAREYAYDANGELVEKRDLRGGIERFHYDPVGRITAYVDPSGRLRRFLYDPAGDLLRTQIRERRTAGAADTTQTGAWVREGEYDGCYYAYDGVGNLIRKLDASLDLMLHWNTAGQLVETVAVRSTVAASGGVPAHIRAQYEYDPFGRRARKVVHAGAACGVPQEQPSRVSRFFWDGNTLVAEIATGGGRRGYAGPDMDDSMQPSSRVSPKQRRIEAGASPANGRVYEWIHYPETFRPFATVQDDLAAVGVSARALAQLAQDPGAVCFYENDPNGAPVRLHDASGDIVWEARYGPTGGVNCIGQPIMQPLRLQGQYEDEETGLHYNRYRYYDPHSGSFISQDPIGLAGGINPYQYAPNQIGWIDPLGLARAIYRGDDSYEGGPIGEPGTGNFTAKDIWNHVREHGDGTFTSFSEVLNGPGADRRGGASFFGSKIIAVSSDDIDALKESGAIKTVNAEEARAIFQADRKLRTKANDVFTIMKKNNEILVHGQIPEENLKISGNGNGRNAKKRGC
ncbi:RHS repeat-associated core domain-containing protein [Burkholderia sp. MR1-5-21]